MEVMLDVQSDDLDLVEGDDELGLYDDDLTVLRLAADGRRQLGSSATIEGRATASFGLDALGARTAEDATDTLPLSREGADAVFQKLEIAASYSQSLAEHLAFSVYGRAQTSFGQPLLVSEQMGIANFDELSTFDAGTLGGDSGWILRGDVQSPWSLGAGAAPFFSRVTPYAFAAMGALYLEEPSAFEEETLGVASLGVGVELVSLIDPAFSNATLTMEYGRAYRDDDEPDENRFTLVGSFRF
jgi:hemolysin activation/secretion protein